MRDLWHHRVNHQSQLCHLGVCTSPQSEGTAIIQIEYNTHQLRDTSAAAAWRPARTPPRRPWLRPARVQFRGKSSRGFVLSRASLASLPPPRPPKTPAPGQSSAEICAPPNGHIGSARGHLGSAGYSTLKSRVFGRFRRRGHVTSRGGDVTMVGLSFSGASKSCLMLGARVTPRVGKTPQAKKKKKEPTSPEVHLASLFYFTLFTIKWTLTRRVESSDVWKQPSSLPAWWNLTCDFWWVDRVLRLGAAGQSQWLTTDAANQKSSSGNRSSPLWDNWK